MCKVGNVRKQLLADFICATMQIRESLNVSLEALDACNESNEVSIIRIIMPYRTFAAGRLIQIGASEGEWVQNASIMM